MIFVVVAELVLYSLLLKWLLKKKQGEPYSKKMVARFLILGLLSFVFTLCLTLTVNIERDTFFGFNPLIAGFLTALLTAALLEECVKFLFFRLALIKKTETKDLFDAIIVVVIVCLGFTILENIEFALGGSGSFIKVFFPCHILFQFVMGYFYGKARVTGEKKYDVLSLVVPILLHTLYDMPIIALMVAVGDTEHHATLKLEEIMRLPYYGYIIPLCVCVLLEMVGVIIAFVFLAKTINKWHVKHGQEMASEQ